MDNRIHPETVTILTRKLAGHLRDRGLSADPVGANMVCVANRAADPTADAALARMSPGLSQAVLCRPGEDGELAWWWIWTARGEDPEYEWLCPATEITTATDAIARVLALADADR